ncbi:MAG: hypothetical protein FJ290_10150 [Planctomycetes bacterium]|nr:hypothetical protein [Planctomycetota bacterium]
MARRYGDDLKKRVRLAHEKMVARHPNVPPLGDHWVADPGLRSGLLNGRLWSKAEIPECSLLLRRRSAL